MLLSRGAAARAVLTTEVFGAVSFGAFALGTVGAFFGEAAVI